jgi:subtilisin family serine protease
MSFRSLGRIARTYSGIEAYDDQLGNDAKVNFITVGYAVERAAGPLKAQGWDGEGVTVAVLDSGVDHTHPMLKHRVWGDVGDKYGHGTAMAGIIAGAPYVDKWGNHEGMAPKARILSIRMLDGRGVGSVHAMASALRKAVDLGAPIVNISAGTEADQCDDGCPMAESLEYAREKGVLVFAAVGNEGSRAGTMACPAVHDYTIAVGAETSMGDLAKFSSLNTAGQYGDIIAPGGGIGMNHAWTEELMVVPAPPGSVLQDRWEDVGDDMTALRGSSPACAMVAGVAALYLSRGDSPQAVWKRMKYG